MPLTDLPLAELRDHVSSSVEPQDFDAFWESTLTEARGHRWQPSLTEAESPYATVDVLDMTFPGFDGEPVKAWVVRPKHAIHGETIVEYVGYGGGRGLPGERPHWPLAGYTHVLMDSRGQAGTWGTGGDTSDPHGSGPSSGGPVTWGINDPATYYYRRLFTDAVRLVDAVRTFDFVDAERVYVTGASQGGAISLACAGLVPDVAGLMSDVPFLCDIRRSTEIATTAPYTELARHLAVYPHLVDRLFGTLSYFDGTAFARRATAPALFSVALMDDIVPPGGVFAAFNAYAGADKQIEVYPFNGHEGGGLRHLHHAASWLRDRLT